MSLSNRYDRFIADSSSSLKAEWQVSGDNVIQKSRNYQNCLSKTASRISFQSILATILNLYKVVHKEHPDKKFEYLPYMSTKRAGIFTSDRGLLKVFFSYEKH